MISGGRLLDQGMYGCVFTPSLACRPGTEQRLGEEVSQALSKLIPAEEAEQEIKIAKRIHRIPFHKQYFVVMDSMCEPAVVQPKERELSRCDILPSDGRGETKDMEEKWEEMRLLRMRYAGKALHVAPFSAGFSLRAFAVHLVAGGALMNLFGVVHRDLHQGNVLVDAHQVPRIIDFNLSFSVRSSKVKASDLSHKYEVSITQESPDSTLVNAIAHGESAMSVIQAICFQKPVIQKMVGLLGGSKKERYMELLAFYRKSNAVRSGDLERWFSLYHRVVDSWAIGAMLVELIHRLSLWPATASRIQEDVRELIPVLRGICAVQPMARMDCVQALRRLDPNHIVLRRYGRKWLEIVDKVPT
jgi:hypothetical protein